MPDYLVTWTIEVEADTPEAAAHLCREMLLDPTNTSTFFNVKDESGTTVMIDTLTGDPNAIA